MASDVVERTRAIARLLDELASMVERYEHLDEHARAQPGRTIERRDAMRAIAARFPGALRELDQIGAEAVRARGAEMRAALEPLIDDVEASVQRVLDVPKRTWIRYAVALQPRLREVLRLKRWLAERAGGGPVTPQIRQRLRAWYSDVAGGRDSGAVAALDDELVDRVATPPGGQVQAAAYADAATALGVTVEDLKRTLYPDGED